jgi:hypothetical protein
MSTANTLRYIGVILVLAGIGVAVRLTAFQISEEPFDQLLTPMAAVVVLIGVGIYMFARAARIARR